MTPGSGQNVARLATNLIRRAIPAYSLHAVVVKIQRLFFSNPPPLAASVSRVSYVGKADARLRAE
jgi:hypothetical protein